MQAQLRTSYAMFPGSNDEEEATAIQFRIIAIIPFASPTFSLRAVDPSQCLLLLGLPSSFHLLHWETRRRTVVNMLLEDEEELVSSFWMTVQ